MKVGGVYVDRRPETFNVPDRLRAFGLDPGHELSSRAGAAVRDAWIAKHGVRPATELTPKSHGKGTHHKARYPESFRAEADAVLLAITAPPEPIQLLLPFPKAGEQQELALVYLDAGP